MNTIQDISVTLIDENPDNDKIFNMNDIDHLAEMIDSQGFRGAIEVMEKGDGRYEIVAGHRRYRAYISLGHKTIPCIVSPKMSDVEKTKTLISSNINSRKMDPIDYARAIQYYTEKVCIPEKLNKEEECMRFFGISRPQYYRYLRILGLNDRLLAYASVPNFPYTALVDNSLPEDTQTKIADILDRETLTYKESNPSLFSKHEVEAIVEKGKREEKAKPLPYVAAVTPVSRPVIEIQNIEEKDETEEILEIISHITSQVEQVYDFLEENSENNEVQAAIATLKNLIMDI